MTTSRLALLLAATAAVFMALSNTVGDSNLFGGVAFFTWVLALLGLLVLGARTFRDLRS